MGVKISVIQSRAVGDIHLSFLLSFLVRVYGIWKKKEKRSAAVELRIDGICQLRNINRSNFILFV